MKKTRLTKMKHFVSNSTAPSDKAEVCAQAVNFRILPLDYFRKMNKVKMQSDYPDVKQEQRKMLSSTATNRPRKSIPGKVG